MTAQTVDYGRMAELLTSETGQTVDSESIVDALFLLQLAEKRGCFLSVADELGRIPKPKMSEAMQARLAQGPPEKELCLYAAGMLRLATLPPKVIMHACYRYICHDLLDTKIRGGTKPHLHMVDKSTSEEEKEQWN